MPVTTDETPNLSGLIESIRTLETVKASISTPERVDLLARWTAQALEELRHIQPVHMMCADPCWFHHTSHDFCRDCDPEPYDALDRWADDGGRVLDE